VWETREESEHVTVRNPRKPSKTGLNPYFFGAFRLTFGFASGTILHQRLRTGKHAPVLKQGRRRVAVLGPALARMLSPLLLAGLWALSGMTESFAGPYNGGPGGPILVVTNSANPFAEYFAEILLAEGLNEFTLTNLSSVSSAMLANYDVVLLGQMALSGSQVTTLSNWVNAGGNLIAMRPDKQLAGLLGLTDAGATLAERYLLVNTNNGPGAGIVGQPVQFHGTTDLYTATSAISLAQVYSNATTTSPYSAVTLRSVGPNGGQAAAFTFDLARSVVYTRQGNPAWSGQERDGMPPIRSDDLYFGAKTNDIQPDWVNLNNVAIPQADEQQRLLANLLLSMDSDKKLLPRFWYFPRGYKAVVVMTGDDHAGTYGGSFATTRFNSFLAQSPPGGSVADWQVPRCTSYIFLSPNPCLTNDAQAASYQAQGFEIGMHLDTGCADYTQPQLISFFSNQMAAFKAKFPSLNPQTTHRIHCLAWSSYNFPAQVSLQFGIRLDVSYYYWPASWIQDRPGMFTGSGMPMRFSTTNGAILDIYQAPTQMTDESGQTFPNTINTLLDNAIGPLGYYGAFVANIHTDTEPEPDADAIFSSAQSRGIPLITSGQLLTWTDGRNLSSISNIVWTSGLETFSVLANTNARGLQGMVPIPANYGVTNFTYNGAPTAYSLQRVKGLVYAMFAASNGNYSIGYSLDTTPPNVTSVLPTNGATGVDTGTKFSVTFSESISPSTVTTNTIFLRDPSNALVQASVTYSDSSFTATLTPNNPLLPLTTYTATIKGGPGGISDLATNYLASDFVSTFTTSRTPLYNFGNTNNGVSSDNIWGNNVASINLARYQAATNTVVTTMRAKVTAISGRYKCAIYTDSSALPAHLLGTTLEITNPADGWQTFPLNSSVSLTNGSFYWLAIWSDDPNARVYYSDNNGTLRWQDYAYAASWPDPITTTGSSSLSYCIYAFGTQGPVAFNLAATTPEDTPTNLTLSGSSTAGPVTFALLSSPTNGILGPLNPTTGSVTYTPNTNFNGSDFFQFTVSDPTSSQATGAVSITVLPVNDAPTLAFASNNVVVLEDSGPVTVLNFAATTVGPANESGQSITNIVVLTVTNATLFAAGPSLSPAGTLTFTPATNANGMSAVTAQARDNGGTANGGTNGSAAQTFTITVIAVNDPPVATNQSVTTLEDTATNLVLHGSDVESPITFAILTTPTNGLLGPLNTNTGSVTYTPNGNFNGSDSFLFTVSDGNLLATGTVSITVLPVNDAPTLTLASNNIIVFEDSGAATISNFAATIVGPANESSQSITNITVLNLTNAALFAVGPSLSTNGTLTFTPATNANGTSAVTVQAQDNGGTANGGTNGSTAQTFTITVLAVNDAPTLSLASNNVVVLEDSGPVTVSNFTATTVGPANESGQSITNILVLNLTNATLFAAGPSLSTNGTLTFTPAPDANGTSAVTVQARDNGGTANGGTNGSTAQTFTITVLPVNDAPKLTLASNNVAVPENCGPAVVSAFAATTAGPPNESSQSITNITVLSITNATLFTAGPSLSTAGTLTFTPATNRFGMAAVTVQALDNGGTANGGTNGSVAQTFTITVTKVNHPPIANNDSYSLGGGVSLDIPAPGVLSNDTDVDGDPLTAVLVSGPLQGSLSLDPSGAFHYALTNHFNGVDTFTYQVSDGQTNSGPATASITVSNQLRISSIVLANGTVTVTWNSLVGKTYRLQYKDILADTNWQDLTPDISATGVSATGTNVVGTASPRFYRVICPQN
jgi:hypothetical protein